MNKLIFILFICYIGVWAQEKQIVLKGDVEELSESEKEWILEATSETERRNVQKKIEKRFENNGFPAAAFNETVNADTVYIVFERGMGYVFGISQNAVPGKTEKEVFQKLSGLESGSEFRLENIKRAERKLERSGYFTKEKNTTLYREASRNKLIPLFYMRDASWSYAEGVVSYSGEDEGWVGNIDVSLKNILGTARDLEIYGFTGDDFRKVSLAYKEPWILGSSWNALMRGYLQDDSLNTDALLEIGAERLVAFEWTVALFAGIGNDVWSSALEIECQNTDTYVLPRAGSRAVTSVRASKKRDDFGNSLEDTAKIVLSLSGHYERFVSIGNSLVLRFALVGGTLLPTSEHFSAKDLFLLGGANSWKGFRPNFLRTRAFGNAEYAVSFQGIPHTAIEAFYQPGIYRHLAPAHGWKTEHQYGLGITQYRSSFSISVYYALRPRLSFEEGLLHLSVKTLF